MYPVNKIDPNEAAHISYLSEGHLISLIFKIGKTGLENLKSLFYLFYFKAFQKVWKRTEKMLNFVSRNIYQNLPQT